VSEEDQACRDHAPGEKQSWQANHYVRTRNVIGTENLSGYSTSWRWCGSRRRCCRQRRAPTPFADDPARHTRRSNDFPGIHEQRRPNANAHLRRSAHRGERISSAIALAASAEAIGVLVGRAALWKALVHGGCQRDRAKGTPSSRRFLVKGGVGQRDLLDSTRRSQPRDQDSARSPRISIGRGPGR
jgi:hypothetical protein